MLNLCERDELDQDMWGLSECLMNLENNCTSDPNPREAAPTARGISSFETNELYPAERLEFKYSNLNATVSGVGAPNKSTSKMQKPHRK